MFSLKNILKTLGISALLATLAGCGPATLNLFVPSEGYTIQHDIAFGSDPRQKLDIYVPDGGVKNAPVLLFLYGGSWQTGDKDGYRWVGQTFASQGVVTVIADYRLYPPAHFPDFVVDAALALRKVHEIIATYGGDPGRIFVAGHSAGAYNAIMLASDPKFIHDAGGDMSWIRGAIGIAGPYDFLPMTDPAIIAAFGSANDPQTQPITFVDGKRPPMLLVAGTADETVSPGNTDRMTAKLKANGSEVQEILYPGVGHIGIILSLAPGFRDKTTLRDDMLAFIRAH
ncbi:MAG TPA: alpha/beta hydrolase [Rhizomicrobium sp.]|jgi:acetyl esterase/lipase|nr:alpha/beta hydrolase [Rhizomicrobium sp.]